MKKNILVFICITILLISLVGCGNPGDHNNAQSKENFPTANGSMIYRDFENMLKSATDVVSATFVGYEQNENNTFICQFSVKNRYWGEDTGEIIFVYQTNYEQAMFNLSGEPIPWSAESPSYLVGEEYLLILARHVSVYFLHDQYLNIGGNLYLPLSDLNQSKLYNEPLKKHAAIEDYSTESAIVSYVVNFLRDNKTPDVWMHGTPYIQSDDPELIITGAPYVLQVRVDELQQLPDKNKKLAVCTVVKSFKQTKDFGTAVNIYGVEGSVAVGNEYIIAGEEAPDYPTFTMTLAAKKAVFDLSRQEEILQYLTAENTD